MVRFCSSIYTENRPKSRVWGAILSALAMSAYAVLVHPIRLRAEPHLPTLEQRRVPVVAAPVRWTDRRVAHSAAATVTTRLLRPRVSKVASLTMPLSATGPV